MTSSLLFNEFDFTICLAQFFDAVRDLEVVIYGKTSSENVHYVIDLASKIFDRLVQDVRTRSVSTVHSAH